ncbi:hypothetical protein HZA33_01265 [Candidatus Pacearchaeota archaeon]|nr:hypothetical protein [Candidatus Pacearchaeota archaeon]
MQNKKEFPCCDVRNVYISEHPKNLRGFFDFKGKCTNIAYAEVFPFLLKKHPKKGWSYLCRKHYLEEQKRLKWKLPACLKVEW